MEFGLNLHKFLLLRTEQGKDTSISPCRTCCDIERTSELVKTACVARHTAHGSRHIAHHITEVASLVGEFVDFLLESLTACRLLLRIAHGAVLHGEFGNLHVEHTHPCAHALCRLATTATTAHLAKGGVHLLKGFLLLLKFLAKFLIGASLLLHGLRIASTLGLVNLCGKFLHLLGQLLDRSSLCVKRIRDGLRGGLDGVLNLSHSVKPLAMLGNELYFYRHELMFLISSIVSLDALTTSSSRCSMCAGILFRSSSDKYIVFTRSAIISLMVAYAMPHTA